MYRDEPSSHCRRCSTKITSTATPSAARWPERSRPSGNSQRDDFLKYRTSHYHAGSTVVSAAGNIRHEDVVERVAALMEKLPKARPVTFDKVTKAPKFRIAIEKRDTQQTQLAMGLPGPSHRDPRRYALQILARHSRRQRQLPPLPGTPRKARPVLFRQHPSSSFADTGMLNVSLGLDQRNVDKSLKLIKAAFEDIKTRGVRPAELNAPRRNTLSASAGCPRTHLQQNSRLGGSVLVYHGRIINPEEIHAEPSPRCVKPPTTSEGLLARPSSNSWNPPPSPSSAPLPEVATIREASGRLSREDFSRAHQSTRTSRISSAKRNRSFHDDLYNTAQRLTVTYTVLQACYFSPPPARTFQRNIMAQHVAPEPPPDSIHPEIRQFSPPFRTSAGLTGVAQLMRAWNGSSTSPFSASIGMQ